MHALAGVEREIRVNDPNGRRKYLRDYSRAFRSYESVIDQQELIASVHTADIVLIGDYHALPACQRFAASLVEARAHPGDRPVVLGVEAIFARDQHILDEWWRREIDEQELRQRIRFDLDWGYDWEPFDRGVFRVVQRFHFIAFADDQLRPHGVGGLIQIGDQLLRLRLPRERRGLD